MLKNIIKAIKNPPLALSWLWHKLLGIRLIDNRDFVGAIGNRSISDNGDYIVAVKQALNNYQEFSKFKKHIWYQPILEHVNRDQGAQFLEIIKSESPTFLNLVEKFKENDLLGGSIKFYYKDIGEISPSTLRYIKVASDLRNLFGEVIGDKIAEIGVGYGGQLLIADKVLRFNQYDLFDLPPVLDLASKYLESHILNSSYNTFTINQHRGDVEYDLVISNYSFSELPSNLQKLYIKKIISKSKKGYLTMNSGQPNSIFQNDKLSLSELENLMPKFELIPENPLTHPGNYIIFWNRSH